MFTSLLGLFSPIISTVLERILPEDRQKVKEIEAQINLELIKNASIIERGASDIILAEAKSEHWLTANWRPLLMIIITAIVAWNYLAAPLINIIIMLSTGAAFPLTIDLPEQLWTLLTVGVSGYIVGRSGEKIADKIRKPL